GEGHRWGFGGGARVRSRERRADAGRNRALRGGQRGGEDGSERDAAGAGSGRKPDGWRGSAAGDCTHRTRWRLEGQAVRGNHACACGDLQAGWSRRRTLGTEQAMSYVGQWTTRSQVIGAVFALAVLSACSGDGGSDAELALRTEIDSLGDTLVVRTIGSADAGARELVEEVRVGEMEGAEEYTFGAIAEILALPDGSVLLFDRLVPALRHYGSDGKLIRTIGRKGGGPGEYEAAGGLALLPDGRVAMWDPRNGRIQLYSLDGTP